MKSANCLPITASNARRLYHQGCEIAISENGYRTTERVQIEKYPAPSDFFNRPVSYYLLISQEEAKSLKKFHFKALAYMMGGFMGLLVSINLGLFMYMMQNFNLKILAPALIISYLAVHCFVSLHEMANGAHNEYLKILKKYNLDE